jgi:hypothetical protein
MSELYPNGRAPGIVRAREVSLGGERLRLAAWGGPDGALAAVTVGWGKHGSLTAGLMDAFSAAVTAGLEHGVPPADLLRSVRGMHFPPAGNTSDPEIPCAGDTLRRLGGRLPVAATADGLATLRPPLELRSCGDLSGPTDPHAEQRPKAAALSGAHGY